MITGNLRTLVSTAIADGASITLDDGDFSLVIDAVKFYSSGGTSGVLGSFNSSNIYTWV